MSSDRRYLTLRLARQHPDLHERLVRGEVSLHGALVQAGIRAKRVTLDLRHLETVARSLRKHLSRVQLAELRELLNGQEAT